MRRRQILANLAMVVAMGAGAGQAASRVHGTWKLVSVGGKPLTGVADGRVPYFTVQAGRIFGYDGCNRFSGLLDKPGSVVTTKMACNPEIVTLPLDWADVAAHLKAGSFEGDELHLPAIGGKPESVYRRG